MIVKKTISLLILGTLLATSLNAIKIVEKDHNKNTHNEIDDAYNAQQGWSFYFDDKNIDGNKTKAKKMDKLIKKAQLNLLQKILDENKKQTKIQKKMLALLQKQIDPKPKMITVNGKKCIANSSADCFDFGALLVAEAKKVPVMAAFLKDPYDIVKAAKYLQWQSKYFMHNINIGNSLQMAYQQFGEKAYPIGDQSPGYTMANGYYEGTIYPAAQTNLIISMKKKISFDILIGKNIPMDIYSSLSIKDIVLKYGKMNIRLVFFDKKSKDVFLSALTSVYKMDSFPIWRHIKKVVDPKLFKQYGVTTTPSFVLKLDDKNKKTAQTILHGKADLTSFRSQVISFMELHKLIDYSKFTEQKAWNSPQGVKAVKDMYKERHGVNVKVPINKGVR